ncbi:MAG: chorismate mutase [Clostridia bacterium]|nr:chorismate mutase [Clostridia bacterium]
MADINSARSAINMIDKEMAALFEKRMDAVKQVAAYKKEHGISVEDKAREAEIIKANAQLIGEEAYRSYYVNFLQETISISKKYQHRLLDGMKVAYSGVEGAFANIAAQRIFPDATCVACSDFKAAYNSVVSGDCDCAVLPLENSYNGDVSQVMDLAFFGSLYISGVYEVEIVQNLLANKSANIEDIKKVISHSQALGQCAEYIEEHGFIAEETVNTAVAAKSVAESGRVDIAAIGSREAAEKFGLKVIESHINKSSANTTRFAVFTRVPKAESKNDNHFIMLFTVKNAAGSLGGAISVIGQHGFNLKALKSRPTKELVWDYYFFAEGEGNINSAQGREMIEELQKSCSNLKIVGSFEKEIKL